jgi:hypothetical protein
MRSIPAICCVALLLSACMTSEAAGTRGARTGADCIPTSSEESCDFDEQCCSGHCTFESGYCEDQPEDQRQSPSTHDQSP